MNKICLITGATDGIGKQTALELARKGFILGLVGRNSEKGTQVVSEIISKTGNESIQFHQADLSSISEMRRLATEIQNTYESLDVLLNNAGAYFNNFSTTVDGFESTFALNHIAYFYLTELLLEMVKNETPGRIINVASAAHRNSKLDFDNIQGIDDYKGWPAYGRSKLMNIMFSYECHRRFSDSGVTFNCLHPGFVNSSFGNNNVGFARGSLNFAKSLFAIPVIKGALTSIYLASSEEVEGVSGEYFDKCKPIKSSKVSYSKNDQNQLWEISESFLESIQKY
ncbi:MAG: SDR family oxidoreductase [Candidatus Marinimicrobia bacterium]|jgi:retinol dehydrogenase 12|nr:SDR family oxidoreductase [Candidatus Neomarinimicrobiota bacterium]MBT3946454.1 SDR family oxidoreductase [Candidatus Neomarinimicrobiota bacterium]MBT4154342.1 SDR family oxidoreductase [Candidatus Neomarinimicrobiota bacterium]MBT4555556.1 SDR family oxidoreductase [Candidatus Neomarinimicrobiota bacterium]MBT4753469.1 SDR family oxidoreductase [Candidatus Neomarinimicrobiota bacterium]